MLWIVLTSCAAVTILLACWWVNRINRVALLDPLAPAPLAPARRPPKCLPLQGETFSLMNVERRSRSPKNQKTIDVPIPIGNSPNPLDVL